MPAPRPWRLEWSAAATNNGIGHLYLIDANGRKIAVIWGKEAEKVQTGTLIVETVNGAGAASN